MELAAERWFIGFSGALVHSFFSMCLSCDNLMLGFSFLRRGMWTSSYAARAAFILRSGWRSTSSGTVLPGQGEEEEEERYGRRRGEGGGQVEEVDR